MMICKEDKARPRDSNEITQGRGRGYKYGDERPY